MRFIRHFHSDFDEFGMIQTDPLMKFHNRSSNIEVNNLTNPRTDEILNSEIRNIGNPPTSQKRLAEPSETIHAGDIRSHVTPVM
jgi:hypothetical protein